MTSLEAKTLKFLSKKTTRTLDEISSHLKRSSSFTETLLNSLKDNSLVCEHLESYRTENICAIQHNGIYEITNEGRIELESYLSQKHTNYIDFSFKALAIIVGIPGCVICIYQILLTYKYH